ncbi:glycosyltransferase [Vibrio breoganii]|nr:glycosyltransferase [Vibrio breoganii]PMI17144.1 hypothetical protein BCU49_13775 [Vibrio breoganii]
MNYIFVHLLNDMSGSPRVLSDLIKNFPKSGEKYLLTSCRDGFLDTNDVNNFIKIPYVLFSNKYSKLLMYVLSQFYVFIRLSLTLVFLKINNQKSTVVVNTLLPFGAAFSAKLFADRTIYYVHETSISPRPLNKLLTAVAFLTADKVIFVSYYVRSFHSKLSDKVDNAVIYNALRSDFKRDIEHSNRKKFKDKHILYVGTLKKYKGIHNFLLLARMMPDRDFVAAVNADVHEFDRFLKQYSIPKNLLLKRRPRNLEGLYIDALFTLNLSLPNLWVETFGLTLLESMQCSVPVIAPNHGGPKEVVNEFVGFLVEPSDVSCIKDIILGISEASWKNMSSNAYEHSLKFSMQNYIQQISRVI